jgi:hypothetical protein
MNHFGVEVESPVRVLVAIGLGAIVGFEREANDQAAGLRTHISVALGACVFGIVSTVGFRAFEQAAPTNVRVDVTRVASQVVVGIGFIGAGVILRHGATVRNLTTAASLWVTAAIGLAAGIGDLGLAAIADCRAGSQPGHSATSPPMDPQPHHKDRPRDPHRAEARRGHRDRPTRARVARRARCEGDPHRKEERPARLARLRGYRTTSGLASLRRSPAGATSWICNPASSVSSSRTDARPRSAERRTMCETSHDDGRIRRVVVGVDGSPAFEAALRWAIREAAAHHADLDVVHAFDARTPAIRGPIGRRASRAEAEETATTMVGRMLYEAVDRLEWLPRSVHQVIVNAPPARTPAAGGPRRRHARHRSARPRRCPSAARIRGPAVHASRRLPGRRGPCRVARGS